ncbi:ribosomal protein S18-alanine N-acetyltransferase [Enterococcus ratti]|uniref:[Ribosomal protein bS18]-alanine N-acetyltransferase n=1 Tax=Enterococcus ratti TaxID=150033 RepID=A0A1L8WII1_9ENTE|nr:ribosomal protein S18-alanine N-acetyltransferase [Enterococcus ratti]OJG80839.1 ribosomal-protein-alanine acetyltransferase [Enterococcus ratti]
MIYNKNDFEDAQLAQCLWELCEDVYDHGSPWTKEQFLADIHQSHTQYYLLVEDFMLQGFVGYSKIIDEAEITNIAIAKSLQKKGYARQLLRFLLDQEKNAGTYTIYLEVRPSNLAARQLYRSEKFRELGKRKSYYHNPIEDAIIMSTMLKTEKIK